MMKFFFYALALQQDIDGIWNWITSLGVLVTEVGSIGSVREESLSHNLNKVLFATQMERSEARPGEGSKWRIKLIK